MFELTFINMRKVSIAKVKKNIQGLEKVQDLEMMLEYVPADQKFLKEEIIANAVRKGITTDSEHIDIAIRYFVDKKWYDIAVVVACKTKGVEEGIKIYQLAGNFDSSAKMWEEQGNFSQAIDDYVRASNFTDAIRLCNASGDYKRAHIYKKLSDILNI